jgi:hypothetical protein
MRHKRLLAGAIILLLLSPAGYSQEAKFKALFMYNFTKYIEWPAEKQHGDFVIGVYGSSPIINELKIIAQKKKVGTQPIVIKMIEGESQMSGCHILYVPENRSSKVETASSMCSGRGTVLITDKPGLAKTVAGLNYVFIDGKQSFEINKSNLERQGVKVNSVLLSLGIIVE